MTGKAYQNGEPLPASYNPESDSYICVCGLQFPALKALRTHVYLTRCPIDADKIVEVAPFCSICRGSYSAKDMDDHVESCRKENTMVCTVCQRGFRNRSGLVAHFQGLHKPVWEQVGLLFLNTPPHERFVHLRKYFPMEKKVKSGISIPVSHPTWDPNAVDLSKSLPVPNTVASMVTQTVAPTGVINTPNIIGTITNVVSGVDAVAEVVGLKRKFPVSSSSGNTHIDNNINGIDLTINTASKSKIPATAQGPLRNRSHTDDDNSPTKKTTSLGSINKPLLASENAKIMLLVDNGEDAISVSSHSDVNDPIVSTQPINVVKKLPVLSSILSQFSNGMLMQEVPPKIPGFDEIEGYECEACGFRFATEEGFDKHTVLCKQERPHICQDCGRGFARSHFLEMHVKKAHVSCACRVCGARFPDQSWLDQHMRTHTQDRPYKCDICSKLFFVVIIIILVVVVIVVAITAAVAVVVAAVVVAVVVVAAVAVVVVMIVVVAAAVAVVVVVAVPVILVQYAF